MLTAGVPPTLCQLNMFFISYQSHFGWAFAGAWFNSTPLAANCWFNL